MPQVIQDFLNNLINQVNTEVSPFMMGVLVTLFGLVILLWAIQLINSKFQQFLSHQHANKTCRSVGNYIDTGRGKDTIIEWMEWEDSINGYVMNSGRLEDYLYNTHKVRFEI